MTWWMRNTPIEPMENCVHIRGYPGTFRLSRNADNTLEMLLDRMVRKKTGFRWSGGVV